MQLRLQCLLACNQAKQELTPIANLLQVNYLESSKFGDTEAEFLWAPYSVFTVESVVQSSKNSYLEPHIITIRASIDNRFEPEDLPISPWY